MICPACQYVFIPPAQPPGLYAREYCPRCQHLYTTRAPNWHDVRGWLEWYRKKHSDDDPDYIYVFNPHDRYVNLLT